MLDASTSWLKAAAAWCRWHDRAVVTCVPATTRQGDVRVLFPYAPAAGGGV